MASATGMPGDSTPLPTGLQLTALDPTFRDDPYPVLSRLRTAEPIHHDTVLRRWVFTRHDDVQSILRDLSLWSDPRKAAPGTFTREFLGNGDEAPSMLLMDDPDHRRLRSLVRRSFTPKAIERWRPRVRAVAERLVGATPDDRFELMEAVAGPLPAMVIAELLGIDPGMHEQFKAWSDVSVRAGFNPVATPDQRADADVAGRKLDAFFEHEIEKRRAEPGEDLISDMLSADEEGERLAVREIVTQCNLLLIAGNVTTTDLIGNGTRALVDHPEQARRLRADPSLLENAVEEMLRWDSPVTNSGRIASRTLRFREVTISEGESLSVSLAAANRDPAVYPAPDAFDIERKDTHHHAFGGGRHSCLGAHLARLEAQETFRALLDRHPALALDPAGGRHAAIPSFRGFESLWVQAR